MTTQLPLLASAMFALAVGLFAWKLLAISRGDVPRGSSSPLDEERRARLRAVSGTYAYFEPLVDELAVLNRSLVSEKERDALSQYLKFADTPAPWDAAEFVACKQIEGVLAGGMVGVISLLKAPIPIAILIGMGITIFYVFTSVSRVRQTASDKLKAIKRRLPFAVDLIALMLEAGASFQEALKTACRENAAHPLGEELAAVVRQTEMGRPRRLALETLRNRWDDQDITDLVMGINKGEELGTPLSTIMRTQADQMRLKRSQWGEKAAAEAQVRMTFPAMVVMLACMLLILAPFILVPLLQMF